MKGFKASGELYSPSGRTGRRALRKITVIFSFFVVAFNDPHPNPLTMYGTWIRIFRTGELRANEELRTQQKLKK
jgi:hypothetical protein